MDMLQLTACCSGPGAVPPGLGVSSLMQGIMELCMQPVAVSPGKWTSSGFSWLTAPSVSQARLWDVETGAAKATTHSGHQGLACAASKHLPGVAAWAGASDAVHLWDVRVPGTSQAALVRPSWLVLCLQAGCAFSFPRPVCSGLVQASSWLVEVLPPKQCRLAHSRPTAARSSDGPDGSPGWAVKRGCCSQAAELLKSHSHWVTSVAWHPSSPYQLVSASYDKTVKQWDVRASVPLHTLASHTDKVRAMLVHAQAG